jgi:hypothetical protein
LAAFTFRAAMSPWPCWWPPPPLRRPPPLFGPAPEPIAAVSRRRAPLRGSYRAPLRGAICHENPRSSRVPTLRRAKLFCRIRRRASRATQTEASFRLFRRKTPRTNNETTETDARFSVDTRERAFGGGSVYLVARDVRRASRAHAAHRDGSGRVESVCQLYGKSPDRIEKHAESGVDAMDSQTQMMLGYHYLLTRAASMGVLPDGILNRPQSETDRNALAGSLEAVRRRPESPGKRTRSFAFPFRPPRFIPGVPGHPLTLPRRPSTCDRRCWNTTRTCSSTTWLWRRSWGFSPRPCCRRAETRKRKSRCRRCST